jgi:hypothetical protein
MRLFPRFLLALLVSLSFLGAALAQTNSSKRPESSPRPSLPKNIKPIEPEALILIKQMTQTLGAAKTIQFESIVQSEFPSIDGIPVIYTTAANIALQRPNKFNVVVKGDGPSNEILFNGKKLFAYSPEKNLVAMSESPNSIDAAAQFAYDKAGIFFPGDDLVLSNPYEHLTAGLTDAFITGKSKLIGGVETYSIIMAGRGLQGQIWIGVKDHLPYMASWIYLGDKARPRTTLIYKNWKIDSLISPDRFNSNRFAKAIVTEFAQPNTPLN